MQFGDLIHHSISIDSIWRFDPSIASTFDRFDEPSTSASLFDLAI